MSWKQTRKTWGKQRKYELKPRKALKRTRKPWKSKETTSKRQGKLKKEQDKPEKNYDGYLVLPNHSLPRSRSKTRENYIFALIRSWGYTCHDYGHGCHAAYNI